MKFLTIYALMEKEENQNQENTTAETLNESEEAHKQSDNKQELDKGVEEKIELSPEEKIKELEDKLARTFAEMENQRRRFEKEKDDAFDYGGFSLARETLNLVDNLERSKLALESDENLKNSETLKKTVDHLNVIQKDMISILKKNNIEEIKSIDQKLDPNLHQAMMEVEDDNKEPGTVVQEIQKGFMMKDRLLRPSLVAVSKKSGEKDENLKQNQKSEENQSKSNKN